MLEHPSMNTRILDYNISFGGWTVMGKTVKKEEDSNDR
jgi:hypothetical protein